MSNLFWEYGRGQKSEDRSQKTRRQEDRKMEESGTEGPIVAERVLVALDASPQSQAALRAAARVAAAMQAELLGLFVEDANLFHLCNSPFCREVGLRTAVVRQLESQTVERQLRVLAAEMRRSLARVAGEAQVHWSFQVTRGAVEHELLTAAENSVLLSLGRTSWLTGSRLGSTTRMVVQRTLRPLLILGNHEVQGRQYYHANKGEWTVGEGLVLRHRQSGQRLFAVHGHQIDFWCDQLSLLTQQLVWSARWGPQQVRRATGSFASQQRRALINFATGLWARWYASQQQKQAQQMIDWVKSRQQPTIVGHTHIPLFPNRDHAPCFNTGSCINPGYLTGIEIQDGLLRFVKWFTTGGQQVDYTLLAPARALTELI